MPLGLAYIIYKPYLCTVFHGIRFKVSKDWLSGDNQFFLFIGELLSRLVVNY